MCLSGSSFFLARWFAPHQTIHCLKYPSSLVHYSLRLRDLSAGLGDRGKNGYQKFCRMPFSWQVAKLTWEELCRMRSNGNWQSELQPDMAPFLFVKRHHFELPPSIVLYIFVYIFLVRQHFSRVNTLSSLDGWTHSLVVGWRVDDGDHLSHVLPSVHDIDLTWLDSDHKHPHLDD